MEVIWSVFYGAVGTLGILHGIADAFTIPYDPDLLLMWTALFSGVWGVASVWKRYRPYLFPAITVVFVWIGFWRGKEIREGFCRSMERVTEAVNAYYEIDWKVMEYAKAGGNATEQTMLLAMAAVVSGLLVTGFLKKKGKGLFSILFALGFFAPFLVGQVPKNRTVWELFVAIMGILAMQTALPGKGRQIRFSGAANKMLIGIAALALVGGAFLLEPWLQTIFPSGSSKNRLALEKLWQDIQRERGENGKGNTAEGGIGNGNVSAVAHLKPGKEPQLQVTVGRKPETDLYLYGYIGVDYNGKQWEKLERGARDQLGRREALEERKEDLYHWLHEKKEEIQFLAEYVDTENAYEYLPYGSKIRNEQEVWGDTYVKGTGRTTYTTSFCEVTESDWKERAVKMCADFHDTTAEYDRFVNDQYLKIDEKQKKKLLQIPLQGETLLSIVESMEQWFGEHITYSLSPGTVPRGKDGIEFFLFENQKGYCVHYATAATLLFRSHGIPARFVSGYRIDKKQWKTAENGAYQVTATGADAHAWTEIYTGDGIWIPVELTPGYGDFVRSEETVRSEKTDRVEADAKKPENPGAEERASQREEYDTQRESVGVPEESESEKQPENTEDGNNPEEKKQNLFATKRIKQSFLLILFGTLGIGSWRFYQVRKRQGMFAKSRTEKVQKIFFSLYEVLRFAGMAENNCLEDDFWEAAKNVCGEMEAELKVAQQTALKAWYSGEPISLKEERELCKIYRKVCRIIAEKLTFREKILFYVTKCFL